MKIFGNHRDEIPNVGKGINPADFSLDYDEDSDETLLGEDITIPGEHAEKLLQQTHEQADRDRERYLALKQMLELTQGEKQSPETERLLKEWQEKYGISHLSSSEENEDGNLRAA